MKKLSLTLMSLVIGLVGFAQSPCSQLSASMTVNQSGSTVTITNTSTLPTGGTSVSSWSTADWGDGSFGYPNPTDNHTYASNGTFTITMYQYWMDSVVGNTIFCSDTAFQTVTISSFPNEISGSITYDSTLATAPLSFKVWLIQEGYDSSVMSVTLTAVDSLITPPQFYWPNYSFFNHPAGNYYVKARVAPSTTNPGLVPTYHQSSAIWNNATQINHAGGSTIWKHINMISGTPAPGPGFIGGNVSQGAGKGTGAGIAGQLVLLRDGNNNVIASTYTDGSGNYSFGSLAAGSYSIYPEEINYQTTPSAALVIGAGTNTYNYVDFEKNSTSIKPKTTAVKDVVNSVFSIYPNPTKGQVNISWKENIKGDAQIAVTDIAGRIVYRTQTDAAAPAQINLSNLNQGVYFIKINIAKGQYTERIVLQ